MDINWENIDNLEDYFITYLLIKNLKQYLKLVKLEIFQVLKQVSNLYKQN